MALVFGDSFDHYPIGDVTLKWSTSAGSGARSFTEDCLRPASQALQIASNATVGYLTKTLPANYTTFVCGIWFRPSAQVAQGILAFYDAATLHAVVGTDASGHIIFQRNATTLATSVNTLTANVWVHVEVKVTIGDAADAPSGRYEVRVNGSSVNWIPDSGTGQDTRNAGNAYANLVRVSGAGGSVSTYQHFYFCDTSGGAADDFLGPCRFAVLRPVAVGTTAEWTGNYADNWENVADRSHDSDLTFNQSSTAGQTDQFVMTDVPSGAIHALQHVMMAKRDAGGARTIRPVTRIDGVDHNGTTVTVGSSYGCFTEAVSVSPDTATDWDDAEVNAAEFGYELVS